MADIERHPLLPATVKEAALKRIRALEHRGSDPSPQLNHWNILNWFVDRAQNEQSASEMAPSERQILVEEYRALQEFPLWGIKPPYTENVVTTATLDTFLAAVRGYLATLAKGQSADFGPFTVRRTVFMRREEPDGYVKVYSGTYVEPEKGAGLLYWLSTLIDQVGLGILHCPNCNRIFLQARRDARYCSRPCQAKSHSRHQREEAQKKKARLSAKRKNRKRDVGKSQKQSHRAKIRRP